MALDAFYEAEANIPEALKEHYVKNDASGHFILALNQAGDGWAVENVNGLKSALSKQQERAKKAETVLKGFSDLGMEASEITALNEELTALRAGGGDVDKRVTELQRQVDAQKAAHKSEVEKSVAPHLQRSTALEKQLTQTLVDHTLDAMIVKHKGEPVLLNRALRDFVKVDVAEDLTADNPFSFSVVDSDGTPRIKSADMLPMSIEELVVEAKTNEQFARAFDAADSSGGGGHPGAAGGDGGSNGKYTPAQAASLSQADYVQARKDNKI